MGFWDNNNNDIDNKVECDEWFCTNKADVMCGNRRCMKMICVNHSKIIGEYRYCLSCNSEEDN